MKHCNLTCHSCDFGLPEIASLGRCEYTFAQPGIPTHAHPGVVEINYLDRGHQRGRTGGELFDLTGGDLFIIPPDEPHDSAGEPQSRYVLYWLRLRLPPHGGSLLMLPPLESALVAHWLSNVTERKVRGNPALKPILDEVLALRGKPECPVTRMAVANRLVRYLLEVHDCLVRRCYRISSVIARIANEIKTFPEREYALSDLARRHGLSESRLKSRFKDELGIPPREYILRRKIDAAKQLLADGQLSVTDVAMRLGFSSSQYFATVFRRFTMEGPRQFRSVGPDVPLILPDDPSGDLEPTVLLSFPDFPQIRVEPASLH